MSWLHCLLRVFPIIQVEGRVAGGRLDLIIVAELSKEQPFYPAILVEVDKEPQILFDFLIYALCLAIGLRDDPIQVKSQENTIFLSFPVQA